MPSLRHRDVARRICCARNCQTGRAHQASRRKLATNLHLTSLLPQFPSLWPPRPHAIHPQLTIIRGLRNAKVAPYGGHALNAVASAVGRACKGNTDYVTSQLVYTHIYARKQMTCRHMQQVRTPSSAEAMINANSRPGCSQAHNMCAQKWHTLRSNLTLAGKPSW